MKQPLHSLMGWPGPMTEKQYRTWSAWLEGEQDRPSRSDHYLMQIAHHLQRSNAKYPDQIEFPRHQMIVFKRHGAKSEATVEEQIEADKALWLAASGGKAERRTIPREEG